MNLDVLIPSLFLPAPLLTLIPPPTLPALERLIARADHDVEDAPATAPWLCERWGVAAPYPIAPMLAEYDGLDASNDGWMFAEPVHLIAQRDKMELFPARFLDLNAVETADLVALLNSHFADRELRFFAPATLSQRWYVRCSPSEIPETTPPDAARAGALVDFQPKSRGALNWRALQNETQMLFYGHAVNEAREAAGKFPVSGVWFWGGGVMPALKKPLYDRVIASSAFAAQLAKKSGIDVLPLSWDSIQSTHANALAVLDSCAEHAGTADAPAWARELERLERDWFLPMSHALGKGDIRRVDIYVPGNGSTRTFRLTRRNLLLRFWRTAKPLASYA